MVTVMVAEIPGWNRSAAVALTRTGELPSYSKSAVRTGSAILLALSLIVVIGLAVTNC